VGKIAIAIADKGFETIACLLVCPMWWKQCSQRQDRLDAPLWSSTTHSNKWVSVADIADAVVEVHSCGRHCTAK